MCEVSSFRWWCRLLALSYRKVPTPPHGLSTYYARLPVGRGLFAERMGRRTRVCFRACARAMKRLVQVDESGGWRLLREVGQVDALQRVDGLLVGQVVEVAGGYGDGTVAEQLGDDRDWQPLLVQLERVRVA